MIMNRPELDPNTQAFLNAMGGQYELLDNSETALAAARRNLTAATIDDSQWPEVDTSDRDVPIGPTGSLAIRVVRPKGHTGTLPVVMFFHGGGWVLGDKKSHDGVIRKIAHGAQAAVVFVDYSRSPEVRYPVALEECYAATRWIAENGQAMNLDTTRLAVAGDSAGGNLTIGVTLLAKERGGPAIGFQALIYPSTNATSFDTPSYEQFASGYFFTREQAKWFWDQYVPDAALRTRATVSPLLASLEQLRGLPPALVITAECDPVRDEGEAYACKLIQAGVPVVATRYLSTVHPFVTLNELIDTAPAHAAMAQINDELRKALA
jgi:acetyl esterase